MSISYNIFIYLASYLNLLERCVSFCIIDTFRHGNCADDETWREKKKEKEKEIEKEKKKRLP